MMNGTADAVLRMLLKVKCKQAPEAQLVKSKKGYNLLPGASGCVSSWPQLRENHQTMCFLELRSTRSYTSMPGADIHIHRNRVRTIATRLGVQAVRRLA